MALKLTRQTPRSREKGNKGNIPARAQDLDAVINVVNDLNDGTIDSTNLNLTGTLDVDGVVTFDDTTDSTTKDTGALTLEGGLGVEKAVFIGTTLNNATAANLATASGVTTIGSATPATISAAGVVGVASTTDATTKDTGSIITEGGIGVEKAVFVGTSLTATTSVIVDTIAEKTATSGVTIDGALIKDGSFTGKQATATATADGLTTGLLTGADQFVTITSANADHIVALPLDSTVPVGTLIRAWVGANGCELRSDAADVTATINNVTAGTTNEAAIPATTLFKVEKVAALTWILTAEDEVGAVITAIIPDAVS